MNEVLKHLMQHYVFLELEKGEEQSNVKVKDDFPKSIKGDKLKLEEQESEGVKNVVFVAIKVRQEGNSNVVAIVLQTYSIIVAYFVLEDGFNF